MAYLPTNLHLGYLKVNGFGSGSSVSFGENMIIGRNVTCKKNQGFGQQNSDFTVVQIPIQTTYDLDIIDSDAISKSDSQVNQ